MLLAMGTTSTMVQAQMTCIQRRMRVMDRLCSRCAKPMALLVRPVWPNFTSRLYLSETSISFVRRASRPRTFEATVTMKTSMLRTLRASLPRKRASSGRGTWENLDSKVRSRVRRLEMWYGTVTILRFQWKQPSRLKATSWQEVMTCTSRGRYICCMVAARSAWTHWPVMGSQTVATRSSLAVSTYQAQDCCCCWTPVPSGAPRGT
mmetsp:Transcript_77659/g.251271  ORF Transcript_77659/g.251271 Transcript_77659/m.251271 type:complete len:206 (-) Transcript_77659:1484-2101(-)